MAPRRFPKLLLGILAVLVLAFVLRNLWLGELGRALIRQDGPAEAEIAVVLAGDQFGNRILAAADLVRQGYVPAVLVSGPECYDTSESDLAIAFAVHRGNPPQWFVPFPIHALSTREEAGLVLGELQRRGIHRFLLVTSDYHTGRSGRIYRQAIRQRGMNMEVRVVAAPDRYFHADNWWRSREGQKTVFTEWTKTVATALGK